MLESLKSLKKVWMEIIALTSPRDREWDRIRFEIDFMVFFSEFSRHFRIFIVKMLISLSSAWFCLTMSHLKSF